MNQVSAPSQEYFGAEFAELFRMAGRTASVTAKDFGRSVYSGATFNGLLWAISNGSEFCRCYQRSYCIGRNSISTVQ